MKVPADSQVVPCGKRIGSFAARCQVPKGGSSLGVVKAREAARRNTVARSLDFMGLMVTQKWEMG